MSTYQFREYFRQHGPRAYPPSHKRCMECGEIIPWGDDCSHGHFRKTGKQIRLRANEAWSGRRV